MSPISMIFAGLMITACSLMIVRRTHIAIGIAMLLSLVFYVQPIRELLPFGQTPQYLLAVDLICALIIMRFGIKTLAGRFLLASISILIIVGHVPALLDVTGIKSLDYTANVIGWLQIAILFGGGNGVQLKRYFSSIGHRYSYLFVLPDWVHPTTINRKMPFNYHYEVVKERRR